MTSEKLSRQRSVDTSKETCVYVSKGESGLNNTLSYTVGTPSASRAPLSDGLQDGTQTLAINYIRRGGGGRGGVKECSQASLWRRVQWQKVMFSRRSTGLHCPTPTELLSIFVHDE